MLMKVVALLPLCAAGSRLHLLDKPLDNLLRGTGVGMTKEKQAVASGARC